MLFARSALRRREPAAAPLCAVQSTGEGPLPRPAAADPRPPAGQKLFSCHVCSNAFSTKGSLKVHMRLHTGAKPFKCPHCELRFRTSGRRKTHMQCHYKPDPRKARRPAPRSAPEGPRPAGLPSPAPADPSVLVMNSSVLTGQFEPSLLQPGLVSPAVLPGSVSGTAHTGRACGWGRPASFLCLCPGGVAAREGAAT